MAAQSYAMRRIEPQAAAGTLVAVLGAYATALLLAHATHQHAQLMVLAVVLTLTLERTQRTADIRHRLLALVALPVIAVAAGEIGRLLITEPDAGDALFVLAIGASIYVRRFGPRAAKVGTLIALPFIALLTTPGVGGVSGGTTLWGAVVALIAFAWVSGVHLLTGTAREEPVAAVRPARTARRLPASTKMAIQMALALALAFALGRTLFPTHWSWVVLTAFIVCSGNRGRADVLHKSGLRIAGALAGTAAATLLAGPIPTGSAVTVAAIFAVLAVAILLRPLSYAYWAAGITAVLALLNGYFGVSGSDVLAQRLVGILLGAAIGVAVSWLVLPVRTTDVLRRRVADALAAFSDVLADRDGAAHRFAGALEGLEQIAAPLRLTRRAGAIDALQACAAPVATLAAAAPERRARPDTRRALGQLARDVGALRRALAGHALERDDRPARSASGDAVDRAVAELEAALARLYTVLRQKK